MPRWTLDDVPWDEFDRSRVDPDILKVVKAACIVEGNAGEYAAYLCNVFDDDPEFQEAAKAWAEEEVQHGRALSRWARMADPGFDFEASFERFTRGYSLPLEAAESVRGSRTGEFISRCVVEAATSSYYTALRDAVDEPVLKEICRRIAADEVRHYKLFYTHMRRYLANEQLGLWRRIWVAAARLYESDDDELAYAYYAVNGGGEAYDRRRFNHAHVRRSYAHYRFLHVERGLAMVFKAVGLRPHSRLNLGVAWLAYWFMRNRAQRLARAGA